MKILVSPAHYVLDEKSVSEFYYASKLLYGLAAKNSSHEYYVLCGFCSDKRTLPANIKVFELFRSNSLKLSLFVRLKFYLWVFYKSVRLATAGGFDVIWHLLPNGRYSFNPFIFFNLHRLFGIKRLIIGRLAHSYGEVESNTLVYKDGRVSVEKQRGGLIYKFLYKLLSLFSRSYFKKFSFYIFYNEFSRSDFSNFLGVDFSKNSAVIPVGFDSKKFPLHKKSLLGDLRFLYMGNLIPRKNVDIALRICRLLKDAGATFMFDIVGDGYEKARLVDLVRELGLQEEVIFHGFVAKDQISKFYKKAHFLFLLSSMEAFGHVLLESWSSGTIFIGSKIQVFEDIVTSRKTGYLVDIKQRSSLSDIVDEILKLKQLDFDAIVANGLEESKKYSWENVVDQYYAAIFG